MKKILFVALAAATMMSCTENEVIENAGNKAAIDFGTVVKNGTRAAVTTNDNFEKFTVNGYKTEGAMGDAVVLKTGFIDNLELTKTAGWKYTDTYYWPLKGNVQFFATSPAQSLTLPAAGGYPTFDYTIKAEASQEDLVAANVMNATKATGAVVLPFQHLLTQVNFSIKGKTPDFTYTVSKLVIKGAKNAGTFKFNGTGTVGAWSSLATTADYTFTGTKTVAPVKDEATPSETKFEDAGNALFMLMPQADLSGVTLEITYTAAPTGKLDQLTFNDTKVLNLTGKWEMGKNIRYTLELSNDASPVEFGTPTVGGWTNEDGTVTDPTPAP